MAPEVVLTPPATFPGYTIQPLGDGPLLALLAGAAPPGLLAALDAFFPVEGAPLGDGLDEGEGDRPQAEDRDLGLELDVDQDDEYLLSWSSPSPSRRRTGNWTWSWTSTRTTSTSSVSHLPPPLPSVGGGGGGSRWLSPRPDAPHPGLGSPVGHENCHPPLTCKQL